MAMTRCKANLHFYDAEKQSSCPYCEAQTGGHRPVPKEVEPPETDDMCSGPTIVILDPEKNRPSDERECTDECLSAPAPPSVESPPAALPDEQFLQTELYSGGSMPEAGQKTEMLFKEDEVLTPVVGWLVCIEGRDRGKDYRIKSGMNEIAREDDAEVDIVIKGDNMISRRYHAELQYDPEDNSYFLIRLKNEAVQVNDVKVKRPVQLSPYDIIQLGETRLVFVPLCSEKFQWKTIP
jgi:hypothetical protein